MLVGLAAFAQQVDHKVHDFGSVTNWDNPLAEFVVTNTGKDDLVFLPTFASSDVLVELPEKRIPPGGSGSVFVSYFTSSKGPFSKKIELYTGNSDKALVLTVKGDIESFAPGALTACPTLKPKSDDDKQFRQQFLVINAVTKEPITGAELEVAQNGKRKFRDETDNKGIIDIETMIGHYDIGVQKDGYASVRLTTHLAVYRGTIIIEMMPIAPEEPVLAANEPELEEDTPPVIKEEEDKQQQDDDKQFQQQFLVIDAETRQPILAAELELAQYGKRQLRELTNNAGLVATESMSGTYDIGVWKDGYETVLTSKSLSAFGGIITIEMTREVIEEPVLAANEPELEDEQPEIVEENDQEFIDWGDEEDELVVIDEPVVEETPEEENEPLLEEGSVMQDENNNNGPLLEDEPEKEVTPVKPVTEEVVVIEETKPTLPPVAEGLATSLYVPSNVLFLIDISKSMDKPDKLPRLKQSIKELVSVLRDVDKITVITYNMEPNVLLPTTSVRDKGVIFAKIDSLYGYGYTHGMKGIETAYQMILDNYIEGGNNQIIVSTDGVFNSPRFDQSELLDIVRQGNRDGVKLSVVGFGDDRDGVKLMRKLSNNGGGNFIQFGNGVSTDALIDEIKEQSIMTVVE